MFTKTISTAAAVLAASTLVSAQTFTECNPLEKDCPADPAFGSDQISCNLLEGDCGAFHELDGTDIIYNSDGAIFRIEKDTNAPTIATDKYIFFGRIDVELQAAPGAGIVTSAVLQSDDLDEIDWEWVGGDDFNVQTNYFSKGDTSTYDRGGMHAVDSPLTKVHTYTIDWTPTAVNWLVNGQSVRILTYEEAKGGEAFPQTPMQIKLGTWVAGREGAPQGTIEWAGGVTDFDNAPFDAIYKSISIIDYAGGSGPAEGAVREYIYGDRTGSFESIEVVEGDGDSTRPTGNRPETPETSSEADETTRTSQTQTRTRTQTAATTTSEADETTSSVPTTVSTVTSASSEASTDAVSETTTSAAPTGTSDGSADEGEDAPDAGHRDGVAFGSVVLAGIALLAQLL